MRDSGVPCIHYGEIYTKYGTSADSSFSFVEASQAVRLRKARPRDVIIASAGETIEDIGKAVAWLGNEDVVIHDACYAFSSQLNPEYVSHFLQSKPFRDQIRRRISSSKISSVSTQNLGRVRIPIPPPAIQDEIVIVLNSLKKLDGQLQTELQAELQARSRQYEFYRDQQLNFSEATGIRWAPMGETGTIFGGLTGKSKADFSDGNARFVSYVNVFNNLAVNLASDDFVRVAVGERQRALQRGDVLFTGSSESAADVAMSSVVTGDPDGPLYLNSFCIGFRPNETDALDPEFTKHLFRSSRMRAELVRTASGVTRFNVSKARLAKVAIPVPPLEEQRRIAGVLNRLDTLVVKLSASLPAEIAARRQQYEYYRDKLLTFPERPDAA